MEVINIFINRLFAVKIIYLVKGSHEISKSNNEFKSYTKYLYKSTVLYLTPYKMW